MVEVLPHCMGAAGLHERFRCGLSRAGIGCERYQAMACASPPAQSRTRLMISNISVTPVLYVTRGTPIKRLCANSIQP